MTTHAFAFVPGESSGEWVVTLPGDACIGEVIVYAESFVVPPVISGLHWPLSELALPFLEETGYDHQLEATDQGSILFGQDSMRADSTGFSITQDAAFPGLVGFWEPTIPADDSWTYAVAYLFRIQGPSGGSAVEVRLGDLLGISHSQTSSPKSVHLQVYNGSTMTDVDTSAIPDGSAGGGLVNFVAAKIEPGGDFTFWLNDDTPITGNVPTFDYPASTRIELYMNDPSVYFVQDIYIWQGATVDDADIEAVRDYLLGL